MKKIALVYTINGNIETIWTGTSLQIWKRFNELSHRPTEPGYIEYRNEHGALYTYEIIKNLREI